MADMEIRDILEKAAARFSGHCGVYFRNVDSGETVSIHGTDVFKSASLIKLVLVLRMGELIEEGMYKLTDKRTISAVNRVQGTGVFQFLNHDYVPTVEELLFFTIALTDNVATNELIDMAGGFPALQAYIKRKGFSGTIFGRKMMDLAAAARGEENYTTVNDVGKLLTSLALHRKAGILTEGEKTLWYALKMQQCRSKLPSVLPCEEPYDLHDKDIPSPGRVISANKTGDHWTTQHDSGIFVLPDGRSYVLVVCTDGTAVSQTGCEFIREISHLVYEYEKGRR